MARGNTTHEDCLPECDVLEEFDLNAALARKPHTIIVDELPHTNVPFDAASRNAIRTFSSYSTPASM
jgi:K+-sensing histidine kinase KdpD